MTKSDFMGRFSAPTLCCIGPLSLGVDDRVVDELLLTIEPIVLGGGKTIWSDNGQALEWELVSTAKAKTGSQVCRYARVR